MPRSGFPTAPVQQSGEKDCSPGPPDAVARSSNRQLRCGFEREIAALNSEGRVPGFEARLAPAERQDKVRHAQISTRAAQMRVCSRVS